MKTNHRQFRLQRDLAASRRAGLSLIEETVVVAIVAVLLLLAVPAARYLFNNIETPAGVKAMIGSALNSARAIAAREQQYVGVRFQHAWYKSDPASSPLRTPQYMIFIQYRPPKQIGNTDQDIFTAVEGIEPIKLPENIGVMDMVIDGTNTIDNNGEINDPLELVDTTTFSILFSPSGKIVVMKVQTRNRNNVANNTDTSMDDVISTEKNLIDGRAMFLQDAAPINPLDLEPEDSRRAFIIYDRNVLRSLPKGERYTRYLEGLQKKKMIYINPYMGTFINR